MDDGLTSRALVQPTTGRPGPLLRMADDRLLPGAGYGAHHHAAVDVVVVVLDGSLRHGWGERATMGAGDVGVLRAGTGLVHDESAGDAGARVVQSLPARPSTRPRTRPPDECAGRPPAVAGWVDLRRPDAGLWVARVRPRTPWRCRRACRVVAPGRRERPGRADDRRGRVAGADDGLLLWRLGPAGPPGRRADLPGPGTGTAAGRRESGPR